MHIFKTTLVLLTLVSLTACAVSQRDGVDYVSTSQRQCQQILFTCPQAEEVFSDTSGCGCQPSNKPDNVDARSLGNLVNDYLTKRMGIGDAEKDAIFGRFVYLGAKEEGKMLTYAIWATAYAHDISGAEAKQIAALDQPVLLTIEQTGRSYIIRGNETIDPTKLDSVLRERAGVKEGSWALDATKRQERVKEMQDELKGQMDAYLQAIMDGKQQPATDEQPAKSEQAA